jgi:methionine-rich copper-binding protein CopC
MRRLAAIVVCLVMAAPAAAHSLLLESSPAAGSVVDAGPRQLALRFNNRIEKRLSRIRLVDDRGGAHDLAVATDGAADRLTAALPEVPPGRYRVEWQVLSTDGHVVTGRYTFTVGR